MTDQERSGFDSAECPKCDGTGKSRAPVLTDDNIAYEARMLRGLSNLTAYVFEDGARWARAILTGGKTDG